MRMFRLAGRGTPSIKSRSSSCPHDAAAAAAAVAAAILMGGGQRRKAARAAESRARMVAALLFDFLSRAQRLGQHAADTPSSRDLPKGFVSY